jgi:hypothetical protein
MAQKPCGRAIAGNDVTPCEFGNAILSNLQILSPLPPG